jgi:isopentenyl diphosphate isomerase/L-lactate dehydrogenase-like FMN-dependent dehydrogenase
MLNESDWLTLDEMITAAHAALRPELWDYVVGGVESETTLRRNRFALDSLALIPRILRDVSKIDLSTTLLGRPLAMPIALAPIGSLGLLHPEGARASARAAAACGTTSFVGVLSQPSLEETAADAGADLIFQLYVRGDRGWIRDILARAEAAGYVALCITVDSAVYSQRDRDVINRFSSGDAARRANLHSEVNARSAQATEYQARFGWDDVEAIRGMTKLPIILKGILAAEDARLAAEAGVSAIYVSNHGGRQLDHAPGAIAQLPAIKAAAGDLDVIFDSGIQRGSDVVKALALGATCVCLGKMQGLALAAGGQDGVERMLRLLAKELHNSMALLGCTAIDQLTPACLQPDVPGRPPGVFSAFSGAASLLRP